MSDDLCIVLRAVNYKDNDRILTLLSRERGLVSAQARGARQAKSKLATASQPFCCAEYEFYERNGKQYVRSASVKESFFGIQNNYDQFSAACVILELAEKVAHGMHAWDKLFARLVNTLYSMERGEISPACALAYFMVHSIDFLGIFPALDFCAHCGETMEQTEYFSKTEGGFVCRTCAPKVQRQKIGIKSAIYFRYLIKIKPVDTGRCLPEKDADGFVRMMVGYVHQAVGIRLKAFEIYDAKLPI